MATAIRSLVDVGRDAKKCGHPNLLRESQPRFRPRKSNLIYRRECVVGAKAAIVLVLSFSLAGCESTKLSCASPDATRLLETIVRDQIGKNIMVDTQNTKIKVDAIKTLAVENKKASCAANLNFDVALRNVSDDPDAQRVKAAIEKKANRPIDYTIEKSEKGEINISVTGLVAW
jgi:hypothetical protein